MQLLIPILPLNLVMLPDSVYPLHIFEDRYKTMVNACILDDLDFGLVSIIDDNISGAGCLVRVKKLVKTYNDGSFDILVKGGSRFYIISEQENLIGYKEAYIELFEDENSSWDTALFDKIMLVMNEVLKKTSIKLDEAFWKNLKDAPLKSFKIAEKSGLTVQQRQELLILRKEDSRLKYILDHLTKVNTFIDEDRALRALVAGDGYINT